MGRHDVGQQGGGVEVRIFPQFSAMFHNFFRICLLLVLTCLLEPCVFPAQKCCSLRLWEVWSRHRNFSAFSLHLPANFRNWI